MENGVHLPGGNAGMSSGISGKNLVVGMTRRDLMGIIGGTAIGFVEHQRQIEAQTSEESRVQCYQDGNEETLLHTVTRAREESPFGIIGVNLLAAAPD